MIGRDYLARQAMTLLRMARNATDPKVSGAMAAKAADLKSRLDDAPEPPPAAKDDEPPAAGRA